MDNQLAQNIGRFGLDLYQALYTPDKNLIFSPLSLYTALAMLYSGTSGESARQLAKALYIPGEDGFHTAMRQLQLYLLAQREDTQLISANSLWLRDTFADKVSPGFLEGNAANYAAYIEALDFNSPAAKNTINRWVSDNTSGLIKQIIEENIDPDTLLYLINTVYFKAKWAVPFDAALTRRQEFYTPSGTVQADMLTKNLSLLAYEDETLQAAVLPYSDGQTSLLVVLPKDLDKFVKNFDAEELLPLAEKMQTCPVALTMPKVDTATSLKAAEALAALGVTDIFDPQKADLTSLSPQAKELQLYVSAIGHRTAFKIDEAGVTDISVSPSSSMPVDQMVMTVNRPYFVAVVDSQAGVLFAGSIVDPTQ